MLPRTEQDWPDDQVQFIDQRCSQILPDRGHAATLTNVAATCGGGRLLQRSVNAFVVVDACLSIIVSVHPAPYARPEEPLHELGSTNAKRILKILVRSSPVAIDGYRKALDAEFRQNIPLW